MIKIVSHLIFSLFIGLNLYASDFELGEEAFDKYDFKRAAELFKKACNDGNKQGCYNSAFIYYNGYGEIKKDYTKAIELYNKSCDSKYGEACYMLGTSYEFGKGVIQDSSKAKEFYIKSCDNGYIEGCYNLGNKYSDKGVNQDYLLVPHYFAY